MGKNIDMILLLYTGLQVVKKGRTGQVITIH